MRQPGASRSTANDSASLDQTPPEVDQPTWADAAELPLALLGTQMRGRTLLDEIFDSYGRTVEPVNAG